MIEEEEKDIIKFGGDDEKQERNELEDLYDEDFYEDYYANGWDDDDVYDFSKPESTKGAWTSLILGVVASLGWIVPIIGLPVTVVGIVLGALNLKNSEAKGVAIAGFVVNIVFLCASIAKGIVDGVGYLKRKRV